MLNIKFKKPVNDYLVSSIRKQRKAVEQCGNYKKHNKRLNFLQCVSQSHGRDFPLTSGEVERCKVDPV